MLCKWLAGIYISFSVAILWITGSRYVIGRHSEPAGEGQVAHTDTHRDLGDVGRKRDGEGTLKRFVLWQLYHIFLNCIQTLVWSCDCVSIKQNLWLIYRFSIMSQLIIGQHLWQFLKKIYEIWPIAFLTYISPTLKTPCCISTIHFHSIIWYTFNTGRTFWHFSSVKICINLMQL